MPNQQSLSEIAADIARSGLPALFIDTCAAFDVIRCAARAQPRVAEIAQQFIEAQTAGELLLYGFSVLLDEAARNRVEVEGEARKGARKIDEGMESHRRVTNSVGA